MADSRVTQSAEQERSLHRRTESSESAGAKQAVEHPVLRLQRQLGNAQVSRMLAQREAEEEELQAKHDSAIAQREAEGGEAEEEELQAKHDSAIAQREAEGGEAEEEELQANHDPAIAQREAEGGEAEEEELQAKHDPAIAQREAAEEEELQTLRDPSLAQRAAEEEELQAKHAPEVGLEGGAVSDSLQSRIEAKRGGGSALDGGLRGQMESAMGTSFKDVRVHHDAESDALNRSITAKAFTTGNDVFLRRDVQANDQSVLAHELTHVVQQRSMGSTGGGMHVGAAGDNYEQEADRVAASVTSGGTQRTPEDEHGH